MKHISQLVVCYASLAILIVSTASQGHASVIASDTFSYPNGTSLGGQTGGSGAWTTAWTNLPPGGATDWVVNGGIAQTTPGTDAGDARIVRRGVTIPNFTTSNYYFRYDYLLPILAGGEGGIFGGLTIGPTGVAFGANDVTLFSQESYHLRLDQAAGPNIGGAPLVHGTNYTIVTRIEPNYIPTQSRVTIWLTNSINALYMTESDTPYLQTIMNTVITPSFVSLYRESQTTTTVNYDNVFLGTSFGDVVPEPNAMVLLGFGLAGLLALRSRVS